MKKHIKYIRKDYALANVQWALENHSPVDEAIERTITEDVAPVVHGKWIEKGEDLYCSKCDHIIPDCAGNATVISKTENRFCYFCGAKMDG